MSSLYIKINVLCAVGEHGGGGGKMQGVQGSWLGAGDLSGWDICHHERRTSFPSKWVSDFNQLEKALPS
jgi:hypothetical protein